MEEKLQQLIDGLEASKFELTIRLESISENSSILKTKLKVPIKLNPDRHYKAGLRYFTVYNHIVNIDGSNNIFRYNNGSGWKEITIIPGAYEVQQIDSEIKRQLGDNEAFNIFARPEINRLGMNIIKERFQVDRKHTHSITSFLGFTSNSTPLAKGYHLAENTAVISTIHTVDLECNIIQGGFTRGEEKQIIYDIPSFTVPIGAKIIEQPQNINYFPLNTTLLDEITVRILDQDGNLINIPGERKFCSLKIIQV